MRKLFTSLLHLTFFSIFAVSALYAEDLYWEEAVPFTSRQGKYPVSVFSDDFSAVAWQETAPNRNPQIAGSGIINIFLAVKESRGEWQQRGIVAGPYAFSGTEPSITNIVIDNKGRIIIAAAGGTETEILISENRGINFSRYTINMGAENSVAPRIFVRADGGYLLFISRGSAQTMSIYYSRSNDGITWSPFEYFTPENTLSLNFLPSHASIGRRDIVFFQSLTMGIDAITTFQLYYKTSDDGGRTWSQARRFTVFNDPVMQTQANANSFDNQRPHLIKYGGNIFMVWERRFANQPPGIYSAIINSSCALTAPVERVNNVDAYCQNPVAFIYNSAPTVVWFDNRSGNNRILLAQRGGYSWENNVLSGISMEASFARPVVTNNGAYVFWQATSRDTGRIFILAPDHSAASPILMALNFTPSRISRSEITRVAWNIPSDTSGIFGFSWSWSQNENTMPPENVMIYNTGSASNLNMENHADKDGLWYFSVRARDFAGNWSAPARITYYRKTEPPPPVKIREPQLDGQGYLLSNTFNMTWEPSSDPYIAGYTWNLQFMDSGENAAVPVPPSGIMGMNNQANYTNQENGVWAFTVAAVDQAGNIGQPSNIILRTNKFIPYTSINYVDAQQDEQGVLSIRLIGRGFSTNGQIVSVTLEYEDRIRYAENFNITSDREIDGIIFNNIEEGNYRLKIEHSTRGWFTASPFITTQRTGTVKFGDYSKEWKPSWNVQNNKKIIFNPIIALAVSLILLCALGFFALTRGLSGVIAESAAIKQEALAVITGDFMPMEKKQKIVKIKSRGRGLSFKIASFTIALVLLVVIMISTPLYIIMTDRQRETLLVSLQNRCSVLLEGIVSSTRTYMPIAIQYKGEGGGVLEMMYLPSQSSALKEANYVTIVGYGIDSINSNHVWASNDPDIASKIDTADLRPGVSQFNHVLTTLFSQISTGLNARARETAGGISQSIRDLNQEAQSIPTTEANMSRIMDIQGRINQLEINLTETLADVSGVIGSYPQFSTKNIYKDSDKFIFYRPIMYRQGSDNNFFRGFVLLEVSLELIIKEILEGQIILLQIIGAVALAALAIGILGALMLSSLIVRPIRKLVKHIEIIRDTEDKSKLAGVDIRISSRDELAVLGATINDMTHGLVKAALAASDLSIGKEIQKKFIPLEVDSQGNKLTTGSKKTPNLDFFGYYEGAKGVSGDYFDYRDLDGRYYAIIKCDVAGKGIPAALIMIQVATMFLGYFRRWKLSNQNLQIENLVYQINDFIETLGFKGRFAAFTLCLFDSQTGIVRFCNAGDNIIHLYDASEGRIRTITLPTTPAAGVLPNFMIETTGGYKVQTVTIDKGDILLLYTDGIEEAKRKFRNNKFEEILCTEGPVDTPHENHSSGQADEEMTPERVKDIINAVMAKEVYTLHKFHNPEISEESPEDDEQDSDPENRRGRKGDLQFDFSTCEGMADDVIMAMVSVEKMFRCYKPAGADEDARVLVDRKIDEFLKNHFLQYRRYCSHTREYPENPAYMYYTHIMEDEQYDDLTIIGIKRN